ncbi:MAG: sulfotransferase family protein [Planctomycetes bacterium]|nr:sulfotransferase family protein [Planctomycetota bacterium]
MLLSDSHSFAFVHVPKTAGSSVTVALGRYATCIDRYWANRWLARAGIPVNHLAPWPYTKFRPHASAATLRAWLPADVFESLFKFAFVRNPWDLLVSYWHYLRSKPSHRRSHIARRLPTFATYVEYEIRRNRFSQTNLLCDRDGRLLVDYVGRYESLAGNFAFVCRRIGIEADLPRLNAGDRGDYRDYYTPPLVARVAEAFAADVERFGYAFEEGP